MVNRCDYLIKCGLKQYSRSEEDLPAITEQVQEDRGINNMVTRDVVGAAFIFIGGVFLQKATPRSTSSAP